MRLLVEEEGLLTDQPTPRYVFKQAVMNGVVSRGDYHCNELSAFDERDGEPNLPFED